MMTELDKLEALKLYAEANRKKALSIEIKIGEAATTQRKVDLSIEAVKTWQIVNRVEKEIEAITQE